MGYQIVEIPQLDEIHSVSLFDWDIKKLMYLWIIHTLNKTLASKGITSYKLELIKVTYSGSYPSIGVEYFEDIDDKYDPSPWIIENAKKLVENSSFLDFYNFCVQNKEFIEKGLAKYDEMFPK